MAKWSITPSNSGGTIDENNGHAVFQENISQTPITYTITYTDGNCYSSTTVTVNAQQQPTCSLSVESAGNVQCEVTNYYVIVGNYETECDGEWSYDYYEGQNFLGDFKFEDKKIKAKIILQGSTVGTRQSKYWFKKGNSEAKTLTFIQNKCEEPSTPFKFKILFNDGSEYVKPFDSSDTIITLIETNIEGHQMSDFKYVEIGQGVTEIGMKSFYSCSNLTAVTIPNSVTAIDSNAFYGCSGLTSVHITDLAAWCKISFGGSDANPLYNAHHLFLNGTEITNLIIPNSVASIGDYAFVVCSSLTSVTIPNSVTSIGPEAFRGCSGLASLTIPNSVTSIGNSAFESCDGLTSVTIPNSVTAIDSNAFVHCSGLTSVHITDLAAWCKISFGGSDANPLYSAHHLFLNGTEIKNLVIPNSVTTIKDFSFCGGSGFTSITIGDWVTDIGWASFRECYSLTTVIIPNSVTAIGLMAFYGCIGLTSVTIPNSVTSIGDDAFGNCFRLETCHINSKIIGAKMFEYCYNLKTLNIMNNVTEIKEHAFSACTSLTSIYLPSAITTIGEAPFAGCSSIASIIVDGNNTVYDSRDNCNAIIETSTNKLVLGCRNTQIPSNITSIGDSAFRGCSGLTSVVITYGVTSIGDAAFAYCDSLTSVTIPNSVTSIGGWAFTYCKEISSITLPESITSLGNYVFSSNSGGKLKEIRSLAINAPSLSRFTFSSVPRDGILHVKENATNYDTWMTTSYLGNYGWTIRNDI